jgi:LysM repeat protein
MTRETKIGLLVGLAFIIVIGILLSDHLTSSTEPPQATLAVAGNNVRSAVNTPGSSANPPITTNVTPPSVAPRTTVPTQSDLAPKAQPVQVAVGGPTATQVEVRGPAIAQAAAPTGPGQNVIKSEDQSNDTTNTTALSDGAPVISKAPPAAPQGETQQPQTPQSNDTNIAQALRDAAKQHGEELESIGGAGNNGTSTKQTAAGMKQYVAVSGDSVSKMALQFMGANTKANRDAIINANPALKQNADVVIVGKTYAIPAASSGATASAGTSSSPVAQAPTPAPTPTQVAQTSPQTASSDNWYTVKEGDSLWKIATEQCGSAAAVQAIRDLNKDTLKGDTVVINMKLRLPNKVASAN